jgi:hypothetical protein
VKTLLVLLAAIVVAICGAVTIVDKGKSNRKARMEAIFFIIAILVTIATTYFVTKP